MKHANLQLSYDGRRRQLDRQAKEIDSLRAALSTQAETLNEVRYAKKDSQSDGIDLHFLATRLEDELKRIQQQAHQFGRDLIKLRAERDQTVARHKDEIQEQERASKQLRVQLRVLKERFTTGKENGDIQSKMYVLECFLIIGMILTFAM